MMITKPAMECDTCHATLRQQHWPCHVLCIQKEWKTSIALHEETDIMKHKPCHWQMSSGRHPWELPDKTKPLLGGNEWRVAYPQGSAAGGWSSPSRPPQAPWHHQHQCDYLQVPTVHINGSNQWSGEKRVLMKHTLA